MANTVLLVDDDAHILYGLSRALRQQPYQLYTARSGEEAIRMVKLHDIDVIVVDENMPGMSGCDVLAWIAKNCPQVVRIVLTGYASIETAMRAINEGLVFQFFTKPCNDAHLAIAIRKALEHKAQAEQHSRLMDATQQQARSLETFQQDLEILTRIVSQDLKKPCGAIAASCQSLVEDFREYLDPKTVSLASDALDAVGEVQRLVQRLLNHPSARSLAGLPDPHEIVAASTADS